MKNRKNAVRVDFSNVSFVMTTIALLTVFGASGNLFVNSHGNSAVTQNTPLVCRDADLSQPRSRVSGRSETERVYSR